MYLIPQSKFASTFYNTYSKTSNAQNKTRSVVLDVVAQLIQENQSTITNKPVGAELASKTIQSQPGTSLAQIDTFFNSQPAISTNIVLVGETHSDTKDIARANGIITAINAATAPTPNLVVFEKGMTYPSPKNIEVVSESNLASGSNIPANFISGISRSDRSYFMAGYLVARAACGNQAVKNNFLLFYGEEHSEIFTFYDQIANQCGYSNYLLTIPRNYNLITTNS